MKRNKQLKHYKRTKKNNPRKGPGRGGKQEVKNQTGARRRSCVVPNAMGTRSEKRLAPRLSCRGPPRGGVSEREHQMHARKLAGREPAGTARRSALAARVVPAREQRALWQPCGWDLAVNQTTGTAEGGNAGGWRGLTSQRVLGSGPRLPGDAPAHETTNPNATHCNETKRTALEQLSTRVPTIIR